MYVFQIIRLEFVEIDFIYLVSPTLVQVLNYMQREHEKNVSFFFDVCDIWRITVPGLL